MFGYIQRKAYLDHRTVKFEYFLLNLHMYCSIHSFPETIVILVVNYKSFFMTKAKVVRKEVGSK